jgi:hypothetical protein
MRRLTDITGGLDGEDLEGMTIWDVLVEYAPEISLRMATLKILDSTLPRHQWLIKSLTFEREYYLEPIFTMDEILKIEL